MRSRERERERDRRRNKLTVTFYAPRDLLELIDLSAEQNGLSRTATVIRLVEVALEERPHNADPNAGEITGHMV